MNIKREIVTESVSPKTYLTYSDIEGEIDDIIKVLKKAKSEIQEKHPSATAVMLDISNGYDVGDIDIEFTITRPETDDELNERIKFQKQREEKSKRMKLLNKKKKEKRLHELSAMTKEEILKHLAGKK